MNGLMFNLVPSVVHTPFHFTSRILSVSLSSRIRDLQLHDLILQENGDETDVRMFRK